MKKQYYSALFLLSLIVVIISCTPSIPGFVGDDGLNQRCNQYKNNECELHSECKLSPSCKYCQDIACYSKEFSDYIKNLPE